MPKIPDSTSIARRDFSGVTQVIRPDISQVGRGLSDFGQSVIEAGRNVEEYYDNKTDFEVADAEANFLIEKQQEDRKYDHDQDYKTIPERYNQNIDNALNKYADTITDDRKKQAFINRNRVKIEASRGQIEGLAFKRERDIKRGRMNDSLNALKNSGIADSSENFAQYVEAGNNLFSSAQFQDLYGAEEASKVKAAWQNDLAKSKLNSMKPEAALNALNSDWAKNLPVDDQIAMRRLFEEKLLDKKAAAWVDENYTGDIEYSREGVASIQDPDLRKATESRLDYVHRTRKQDEAQLQADYYREYGGAVIDGQMTVNDIRQNYPDKWNAMTVGMKENLLNIESQARQPPKNTPFEVTMDLVALKAQADRTGDFSTLLDYIQTRSYLMSDSDRKKWIGIGVDGAMPKELESGLTDQQAMMAVIPSNATKDEKSQLLGAIGDWRMNYIRDYNKDPSDDERKKEINRLVMEVDTRRGMFGGRPWIGGTSQVYELGNQDKAIFDRATEYARQKNMNLDSETMSKLNVDFKEAHEKVMKGFGDIGISPTQAQYEMGFDYEIQQMGY